MSKIASLVTVAALSAFTAATHAADPYPSQTIRIISPYSAGGTNDFLARVVVGGILDKAYDQPVVVENRLGAGGVIGSDAVAKSAPDGHTLLMGSISTHSIGPTIYSKLPYDIGKDFTPISIVADVPLLLVVNPQVKANNLGELLALIKSNPEKFNYASAGAGTIPHMTAELFKTMAKVDIVHIPYKGDSLAINDLVGGQVQMMFANMPSAIRLVRAGKLRALAVAGKKRSPALPEIPTVDEAGVADFDVTAWYAVFGPGGMPANVVSTLNAAIAKGVRDPAMQNKIREQGAEPVGNSVAEFAAFLEKDQQKWKRTAATTGIKLD